MRFNGRYVVFQPKDPIYINLKLADGSVESYTCSLPVITVHNLVIGKVYVDVNGKSQNVNNITGEIADMEFKERGWSGKNAGVFTATTKTKDGKPCFRVHGRFNQYAIVQDLNDSAAPEEEVWRARNKPSNSDFMYQFSRFTLQMNHINDALKERLPPTDARFRPDQRAFENGDYDLATKEKHRLEEAQRARRKEHEKTGQAHVPSYFELTQHEITGEKIWKFNGRYWQDRANKDWSRQLRIYE